MNIRAVADSASQLKRKYLLALRPRPLGPLDRSSQCHKWGPCQAGLSEDHQAGGGPGLLVWRLRRLTERLTERRQGDKLTVHLHGMTSPH